MLNIQANPENWDHSMITAIGVQRNGRSLAASPCIMAADLPESYLAIWHAAVEQFRAMGNGDWNAASVSVCKLQSKEGTDVLHCDIYVSFPDLTTDTLVLDLDAPEMIAFYDHYMDEASWPDPTRDTEEISGTVESPSEGKEVPVQ